jgi:uncharacterized protein YjbI with pentapeptide repeats
MGPITAPRVRRLVLPPLAALAGHRVGPDDALDDVRIEAGDGDAEWPGLHLHRCELSLAGLAAADLAGARLVETRFTAPDLASLRLVGAQLRTVELLGGRLGDLDAAEGRWEGVRLEGARIGYLSLRGATVADLELVGCQVDTLDLAGAQVTRARFEGTGLGELLATRATLGDVDLRAADLDRVEGVLGLAGAVVAPGQLLDLAPQLASALGLVVAGPDAAGAAEAAGSPGADGT